MSSTHDEEALAAAYVLGALDSAERRAFEAHVDTCASCRDAARSLQRVADALARSIPQRTPPLELRARVLAAATGGAAPAAHGRRTGSMAAGWLPLAASIVLVVGLGAYAWRLQGRASTLEARLHDAERRAAAAERDTIDARRTADGAQTALAVLAARDLMRIDLAGLRPAPGATARALWSRQRGLVFTATGLPVAPAGRVYQVWVVTATAPVSAGLVSPDSSGGATAFFHTPTDLSAPVAVAVTLEPAGGVSAPTGEMYLLGKPTAAAL